MSDFRPENEISADPGDRHSGRNPRAAGVNQEPQINMQELERAADDHAASQPPLTAVPDQGNLDFGAATGDDAPPASQPSAGRNSNSRKAATFSRRHIIIGIIILLLLLLMLGLAMRSPKPGSDSQPASTTKNIELPMTDAASNSMDNATANAGNAPAPQYAQTDTLQSDALQSDALQSDAARQQQNPQQNNAVQSLTAPAIVPAQDNPPAGETRLTSQSNLNDALAAPDAASSSATSAATASPPLPASPLPTQPATQSHTAKTASQPASVNRAMDQVTDDTRTLPSSPAAPQRQARATAENLTTAKAASGSSVREKAATEKANREKASRKKAAGAGKTRQATAASRQTAKPPAARPVPVTLNALKTAPASYYTVQLSSASNLSSLQNWAKKQQLTHYVVYKTTRNNQPWYVLVSGIYPNRDAARHAISALPASVQAEKPWIKPMRLVHDDLAH